MSWKDRIIDPKIVTGDGQEFLIELKDIPKSRNDRATVFTFSEFSGDFVQKLSSGGDAFSFRLWFSGADHDIISDKFEEATKDIRPLKFYHPYRKKPYLCILLGLKRLDSLEDSANETSFGIDLHETISKIRPENSENVVEKINNISITASAEASEGYEVVVGAKTAAQTGGAGQETTVPFGLDDAIKPLSATKAELDKIISKVATKINKYYNEATDFLAEAESIRFSALSLVSTIDSTARSTALVMRGYIGLVGKTVNDTQILTPKSRIAYYKELIEDIGDFDDITNFELLYPGLIVGVCQSSIISGVDDFNTRLELNELIDTIFDLSINFFEIIDPILSTDQFRSYRPNLEAIKNLMSIVSFTLSKVDELVFELKQERSIVVKQQMALEVLAYHLFGAISFDEIDSNMDTLIQVNKIKGTDVFSIKPGEEIIYYI